MFLNDSANFSESENEPHSAFSQTEHNIVAAYLITAGVVSLLSNIVVLGIFVKYKELRTATNAIIINLAFTDIGVSGIGYPMSAASDLHGSWKFGYAGCQIYAALNIFFGMASIGLLTVVAIDRYLTICKPHIGSRLTANNYTVLILAAWINAVFWASMPIVGWASYAPDPTGATCTVNWRKNDASFVSFTMSVIAVNFVIPLSVMFYCYFNVSRTMKRYARSSCLESINIDWSDQVDVTKVSKGHLCDGQMSNTAGDHNQPCLLANECVSKHNYLRMLMESIASMFTCLPNPWKEASLICFAGSCVTRPLLTFKSFDSIAGSCGSYDGNKHHIFYPRDVPGSWLAQAVWLLPPGAKLSAAALY
uniref:visual pigment-like receptor peropsin isoform X1 n=1 Tax=Podarcis muralis TaxID=64176 RepID=UPI00109F8400|nr:visual pigment-like receptor peropsin isoform X1 [Podarcis muralis]